MNWIKVEDGLPEGRVDLLVYNAYKYGTRAAEYNTVLGRWYCPFTLEEISTPTHWVRSGDYEPQSQGLHAEAVANWRRTEDGLPRGGSMVLAYSPRFYSTFIHCVFVRSGDRSYFAPIGSSGTVFPTHWAYITEPED